MRNLLRGVTEEKVTETLNEVIEEEIKSKNKYKKISQNMIEGKAFESINNFIPLFNSVVSDCVS